MSDIPETSYARMLVDPAADFEEDEPNNEIDDFENLSEEEKLAARQSFADYCTPVEFYNYFGNRAKNKPYFLHRCLDYRIKAKHEKRVVVTVSLLWNDDKTRSLFPLCICLTRLDPDDKDNKEALKYQAVQRFTFRGSSEIDENGSTQVQANFLIPKLAMEAKSHKYYLLILASVENPISLSELNTILMPWDVDSNESRGGENCLYQEVSFIDFYNMWDKRSKVSSENEIQIHYDHHLIPCIVKYCFQRKSKCITIHDYSDSQDERDLKQLQISMFIKKPRPMKKYYDRTITIREVGSTPSSLFQVLRLRKRNVAFLYRYYDNKLLNVEVTEDFHCAFCLFRCPTFKVLQWHLTSLHDALNFDFSIPGDLPSVYVSIRDYDLSFENVGKGVDPRTQTFFFCAKRLKRRELNNVSIGRENDTEQMLIDAEIPAGETETLAEDTELLEKADGSNAIILHPGQDFAPPIPDHDHETQEVLQVDQGGVSNAIILYPGTDCVPPTSDHDHRTPATPPVNWEGVSNAIILHPGSSSVPSIYDHDHGSPEEPQSSKRRKLPIEPNDSKIPAKLKKRTFYHSHKYQAMALEEVLLDEDSEDEINEYAEEVEERRKIAMLDVTDDEKQFLFMWNTFIRKQRVVADGHVNWACEAFTKHHSAELAQSPPLTWCWRLFMIKLWNHNLLDARTFNQCSIILEEYKKQNSDISQRLKQIEFYPLQIKRNK